MFFRNAGTSLYQVALGHILGRKQWSYLRLSCNRNLLTVSQVGKSEFIIFTSAGRSCVLLLIWLVCPSIGRLMLGG